jgi:DNA-directed RNA polymerase beta' subunit
LGNNQIRPESVVSNIMGSTSESRECETCHYNRSKCPGHPGYIHLGSPVLSSIFIPEIISFLKIICGKCGKIIVKNANIHNIKSILTSITSKIKKGFNCEYCAEPHPHIFENRKENRSFLIQELYHTSIDTKETKKLWVKDLFPSDVKLIFSRITPETLEKLGITNPDLAPINYVNDYFYVLPNSVRPNALSIGAGKGSKHEMNQQINNILKQSNSFGDTSGGLDTVKNVKLIKDLSLSVYSFRKPVPTTSDKKPASIASSISSKSGAIRAEVLGARILRIARHFITGDPSVKLDEVCVPKHLAEQIQIEEVVTEYNRESLMRYIANGNKVYPRCRSIQKKRTGLTYTLQVVKDIILEPGDKIYRDLIDGDRMGFCRQPTLMKSNITGMVVRVVEGGKTFAFNPNITTLFGADFDGKLLIAINTRR